MQNEQVEIQMINALSGLEFTLRDKESFYRNLKQFDKMLSVAYKDISEIVIATNENSNIVHDLLWITKYRDNNEIFSISSYNGGYKKIEGFFEENSNSKEFVLDIFLPSIKNLPDKDTVQSRLTV